MHGRSSQNSAKQSGLMWLVLMMPTGLSARDLCTSDSKVGGPCGVWLHTKSGPDSFRSTPSPACPPSLFSCCMSEMGVTRTSSDEAPLIALPLLADSISTVEAPGTPRAAYPDPTSKDVATLQVSGLALIFWKHRRAAVAPTGMSAPLACMLRLPLRW